MLRRNSFLGASLRATALTTLLGLAVASAAQAAVITTLRSNGALAGTPKWILSHLSAYSTRERSAIVRNASGVTYPLNGPFGLTVAPNGDLYVANLLANQVLVYATNLVQKTRSTISAGLSEPTGVAFDSAGEVYVSNSASDAITVYSANHTAMTNRTIFVGQKPVGITIDGLDNLFVNENYTGIGLHSYLGAFQGNLPLPTTLVSVNAMAERGHLFAVAGTTLVAYTLTEQLLGYVAYGGATGGGIGWSGAIFNDPLGVAFDASDNTYAATNDPAVVVFNAQMTSVQRLVGLGFVPAAIAVDSAHNHLFIADFNDSAIQVYTLAGNYITTLQ